MAQGMPRPIGEAPMSRLLGYLWLITLIAPPVLAILAIFAGLDVIWTGGWGP